MSAGALVRFTEVPASEFMMYARNNARSQIDFVNKGVLAAAALGWGCSHFRCSRPDLMSRLRSHAFVNRLKQ